MAISLEIKKLFRDEYVNHEVEDTASEIAGAICSLLSEVELANDSEDERLHDWTCEIRTAFCKVIGEHTWEHDHCCYWGHQYCIACSVPKYPELSGLRCSEAERVSGAKTEEEYLAAGGLPDCE